MVNSWTRNDLPDVQGTTKTFGVVMGSMYYPAVDSYADAVVEHLNAHHPKSDTDRLERQAATIGELQGCFLRVERDAARWRRAHEIVEGELDQAREQWKKWEYRADEWKARAEAAEACTAPAITREDVEAALAQEHRMAFGTPVVSIEVALETVCSLFGIEAGQATDPVTEKARELRNVAQPDAGLDWEALSMTAQEQYLRMARHVLGQEAGNE